MNSRSHVFISYAHGDARHMEYVARLAATLAKQSAFQVIWDLGGRMFPTQGWTQWMIDSVDAAQKVICVCSPDYKARFERKDTAGQARGAGKGVTFEGAVITQALCDAYLENNKFIPVLPPHCEAQASVPRLLAPYTSVSPAADQADEFAFLVEILLDHSGANTADPWDFGSGQGSTAGEQALAAYRQSRIAEWSQRRYAVDKRFTRLSLLLDRCADAQRERFEKQTESFDDLADILRTHGDYPALVLLGAPGSGKSTLLRRLDLECAQAAEADDEGAVARFSLFVSLRDFPSADPAKPPPEPLAWLRARWAEEWGKKCPGLPALDTLLAQGPSLLLLDALNEMPHTEASYRPLVRAWAEFLADLRRRFPACRVVFSCRSLDYSASLSTAVIPVPHVDIEKLSPERIREFLHHYAGDHAQPLYQAIERAQQFDLYGTAFFLKMLVDQAGRTGQVPPDRAALFTAFVRKLLAREVARPNPLLTEPGLLSGRDLDRLPHLLESSRNVAPYALPEGGPLFPKLAELAHALQAAGFCGERYQVVETFDRALAVLGHPAFERAEAVILAACALSVLEQNLAADTVQFFHQLLQEYFAARRLAAAPEPAKVALPWRADEVAPNLADTLAGLKDYEPLPPLQPTGWEETTLLAATMAADRGGFIEGLMSANLPLAGRAAAQNRVGLAPALIGRIQQALLARMTDPAADLRARIAAGKALGELGDPRFTRHSGPHGDYLLPPWVQIAGGSYRMGDDTSGEADEKPAHAVELAPFAIGQFPVTNGEWRCFMDAGGYEDERWWQTEAAKAWRSGESTSAGSKSQWRKIRQTLQRDTGLTKRLLKEGRITTKQADDYDQIAAMSNAEFDVLLDDWYPAGRQTRPTEWFNDRFNNPTQPLVGICWFEAQAYCAWLSAQSGQTWRLPTEAEWEAAARGSLGRKAGDAYPWGKDFDASRCNTFESHIRATTPVGLFAGSRPGALADMSGNVWEWTSSVYHQERFPYPWRPDGREDAQDAEAPRVLRGGSWFIDQVNCRCAYRFWFYPGSRSGDSGFRLVCAPPIL